MALSSPLFLAHRTEESRAAGLHDAPDRALAAGRGALLALAIIDPEIVLEIAERAIGALVIAQRRATGCDRLVQHRLDRRHQPLGALVRRAAAARNSGSLASGRQQRAVERLA